MAHRLQGRNAVVTGAGRGVGRAIALALAREGANIVACDLGVVVDGTGASKKTADATAAKCRQIGVKAIAQYGDVSDFKAADEMIQVCIDRFGSIDILCNIAGVFCPKTIFQVSEEEWDKLIAVHLKGTFNLTRHATPLMKRQRYGRIVNCTSAAWVGMASDAPYSAAKGGISTLTYSTAWDMGAYGVTCNAIAPIAGSGDVSAMRAYMWPRVEEGQWTREIFHEFMGDLTAPIEYMSAIVPFLCSDAAAHINGCIFSTSASRLSYWAPARETVIFQRDWERYGGWTWEDVEQHMPTLLSGYVNQAPPRPE